MFQQMGIVGVGHPVIWVLPCPAVNRQCEREFLWGRRRLLRKCGGRVAAEGGEEGRDSDIGEFEFEFGGVGM